MMSILAMVFVHDTTLGYHRRGMETKKSVSHGGG